MANRFDVALDGADETGPYRVVYMVLAADENEAVILARASAALQDIAVIGLGGIVDLGTSPFESDDARRVTGKGEKRYNPAPGASGRETGDGADAVD